ncbi:MAG: hypothetical protein JW982_04810 [Spirochaetes bacterium]|nr:hypothetical protein [Spirochaetota bacterium]
MEFIRKASFVKNKFILKAIIFIMMTFISTDVFAVWNHSDAVTFEKKLIEFRYTLYPYIENLDYELMSNLALSDDGNNDLSASCAEFIESNKKNITEYRKYLLNLYMRPFPENDSYEEIEVEDFSINPDYIKYRKNPAFSFITINPYYEMRFFMNYFLGHMLGAREFGELILKQQIGGERIFIRQKKNEIYEIMIDQYFYRFISEYNISNSEIKILKIYKKKSQIKPDSE